MFLLWESVHTRNPRLLKDGVVEVFVLLRDVQDVSGAAHLESIELLFLYNIQCSSFTVVQQGAYDTRFCRPGLWCVLVSVDLFIAVFSIHLFSTVSRERNR